MIEGQPTPAVEVKKHRFVVKDPLEFDVNMRVGNNNLELTRLNGLRGVLMKQIEAIDAQIDKVQTDSQFQLGRLNRYETMATEGEK